MGHGTGCAICATNLSLTYAEHETPLALTTNTPGFIMYYQYTISHFYLMLDTAQFAINYDKYIHVWNDREIGVDINWKIWHCSSSCPSTGFNWYKMHAGDLASTHAFFREHLKLSPMVWQTRRNNSLNNTSCINQNQTGYTSLNIL